MKKKFVATALFLAAGASMSANAGFIAGNYTLANGNTVALQGLEWMPLTYTAGLARKQIEDGFTDRFGGDWSGNEWRYATQSETETLLRSLWGGTAAGWSTNNYAGANWFLSEFGGLGNDTGYGAQRVDGKFNNQSVSEWDWTHFIFGNKDDCSPNAGLACWGAVYAFENSSEDIEVFDGVTYEDYLAYKANSGPAAGFNNLYGCHYCSPQPKGTIRTTTALSDYGHLLVRTTDESTPNTVPTPTAISLLGLGLFGLALHRRRRVSK